MGQFIRVIGRDREAQTGEQSLGKLDGAAEVIVLDEGIASAETKGAVAAESIPRDADQVVEVVDVFRHAEAEGVADGATAGIHDVFELMTFDLEDTVFDIDEDRRGVERLEIQSRSNEPPEAIVEIIRAADFLVDQPNPIVEHAALRAGAEQWTRLIKLGPAKAVGADAESHRTLRLGARVPWRDIHHAAERGNPVEQGLRAPGDLLAIDIDDIGHGILPESAAQERARIESTDIQRRAVARERAGLLAGARRAEEEVGRRLELVLDNAGAILQGFLDVHGADIVDELAGHDLDRGRQLFDRHVEPGAGDRVGSHVSAIS